MGFTSNSKPLYTSFIIWVRNSSRNFYQVEYHGIREKIWTIWLIFCHKLILPQVNAVFITYSLQALRAWILEFEMSVHRNRITGKVFRRRRQTDADRRKLHRRRHSNSSLDVYSLSCLTLFLLAIGEISPLIVYCLTKLGRNMVVYGWLKLLKYSW